MKSKTKKIATAGLAGLFVAAMAAGVSMLTPNNPVSAAESTENNYGYYYNNLTVKNSSGAEQEYTLAKKFYKAFEEMNAAGDFKDGKVSYSLTEHDLVTGAEIEKWVMDGDLTIPKAFSAARDTFLSDHPEIFYIDFYKLTISAARVSGEYKAYIDSGRDANIYQDGGFTSEAEVNKAIEAFDTKVDKIVADAEKVTDEYGTAKEILQIKYVNKVLAESIEYDYGALNDYLENGSMASSGAFIESAYGGLVVGKCVCTGYSRAYKVILDELGIPCIVVKGNTAGKDEKGNTTGGSVGHAWNYVWAETPKAEENKKARAYEGGKWYAVDVTWNSAAKDKNKYTLMSATTTLKDRNLDPVISSSGYELKYPELSETSYGSTNSDSLNCWISYTESDEKYDGKPIGVTETWEYVSYNGKSAKRLAEEDNLRIAYRSAQYKNGELKWTGWFDVVNYAKYLAEATGGEFEFIADNGVETKVWGNTSYAYSQFAVFADLQPTLKYDPNGEGTMPAPVDYGFCYDGAAVDNEGNLEVDEHVSVMSNLLVNQSYGTYTPAPYITKASPATTASVIINDGMANKDGVMADNKVPTFTVTYDEELYILDETKPIGISYVSSHESARNYSRFLPFEDGSYVKLVADSDGKMNTLQFRFAASLQYAHDCDAYEFTFSNVGSKKLVKKKVNGKLVDATSDKEPNPVRYTFGRDYIACPNVFGDGRLWVDCVSKPTLLDNSDLSEVGFTDASGEDLFNQVAQRSQMMLVVEKVDDSVSNSMLDEITAKDDFGMDKEDIISSETYSLDLQICGKYARIPDKSYVKIALAFPEGYGPDDAGVTFKIYHRKHIQGDEYIIEEIPCVVTKMGIVATVTSFSPYMVAVVPEDKVTEKTVFASVDGKGGKLNNADGQIQTVKKDGSYTYTVNPDEGYQLYRVTLNGTDVTEKVKDNKLTLNYADLEINNEVEFMYIAEEAVQRHEEQGIVVPVKVVVGTPTTTAPIVPSTPETPDGDNTLTIVIVVTVVIVVVAGAVITTLLLVNRKKRYE